MINHIEDYKEYILLNNGVQKPWFASVGLYWALTLLGLGWFIRILLYTNSQRVIFDVSKLIIS